MNLATFNDNHDIFNRYASQAFLKLVSTIHHVVILKIVFVLHALHSYTVAHLPVKNKIWSQRKE